MSSDHLFFGFSVRGNVNAHDRYWICTPGSNNKETIQNRHDSTKAVSMHSTASNLLKGLNTRKHLPKNQNYSTRCGNTRANLRQMNENKLKRACFHHRKRILNSKMPWIRNFPAQMTIRLQSLHIKQVIHDLPGYSFSMQRFLNCLTQMIINNFP